MDSSLNKNLGVKAHLPVTMLDWEGRVATVIFTGGCNFRCPFCHNPDLAASPQDMPDIPFEQIKAFLEEKKGWIDGVVITGGEPTLQPALSDLISEIRSLGYPVKLDTNGTHPEVLKKLIEANMLDFVAMDIKNVFDKYAETAGAEVDTDAIKTSIELIIDSGLEHEFRTTVYPPAVLPEDVVEMARYLGEAGGMKYAVQQFNPKDCLSAEALTVKPYGTEIMEKTAVDCGAYIKTILR